MDSARIEDVIGLRIHEGRDQAGISQAQLGERLGELLGKPWPRQAVSAAEKGRRAFTAAELVAFAVTLGCNVTDLLEPSAEVETVTLLEGPALPSRHFRAGGDVTSDLQNAMESMRQFRQSWEDLQRGTKGVDIAVRRLHETLVSR